MCLSLEKEANTTMILLRVFQIAAIVYFQGVGVRATTANAHTDTCAYTFNIPASDCQVAPEIEAQLGFLETIVQSQQATIQNQQSQLQLVTDRVMAIESPDPCPGIVEISQGLGTTYVRWGRTECPETAQLVYEGYAGNSHYSHGGGVDFQCLPKDPEWPSGATSGFQSQSYMYGVEYERQGSPVWHVDIHDADVPCAVCSVTGRGRSLMIPAKMTCPDDWTNEYSGILAAEYHGHSGSNFVCVDSDWEAVNGGDPNDNGGLLYVVEAKCGSLKCPPYVDGYELSCAVCTR